MRVEVHKKAAKMGVIFIAAFWDMRMHPDKLKRKI
jgi:hypothetical protein